MSSHLSEEGLVVFKKNGKPGIRVLLVDGSAKNYRWLTLESDLRQQEEYSRLGNDQDVAKRVLACGVTGKKPEIVAPPESIVDDGEDDNSIVSGDSTYTFWGVDEIRADGTALQEMLA